MYEVEVKAKLNDRIAIRKKLEDMGCKFSEELHQIDTIFTPETEVFPSPKGRQVLRIRKENDSYIFNIKINQSSRQDCIEHEVRILDNEEMEKIILLLGFKQNVVVDKIRIKTHYKDMEIVLDTVKDLGEFIEAEKIVTEGSSDARKNIQEELFDFLETLGVKKEDRVIDGKYDIMLFEKFGGK